MVLDKLVYQMAVQGGGSPLDILERAELLQKHFDSHGIELVEIKEEDTIYGN